MRVQAISKIKSTSFRGGHPEEQAGSNRSNLIFNFQKRDCFTAPVFAEKASAGRLVMKGLFLKWLLLVCFISCFYLTELYAQRFPFEFWHEGRIVLLESDTLKGTMKYNLENDILQYVNPDKTVDTYTARKVLYFEIFDATVNTYREFYALPYSIGGGYKAPLFFEVLEEGRLTLLARERVEVRTTSGNPYFYYSTFAREVLVYKFYYLDNRGDIIEYSGNKNDLLRLMGRQSDDVNKFMRANKLKTDRREDLVKITRYYNSLFSR